MPKLKTAIIGCGRISANHIKALVDHKESAQLVSVCDLIKAKAESKAQEYEAIAKEQGIQVEKPIIYAHYKKMLEKEEIDTCSICTESGYHADISLYCMNKKKHILVEKPMAMSLQVAEIMIKTAQKNNLRLGVCFQNRFNLTIQKLRQAVIEHRFGTIFSITARILWNRNYNYYQQASWRGTWALDGGCLMNQCIHNIDLLQWMALGDIQSVYGQIRNFLHPYNETEDHASIIVNFKDGSIGNIEGTVNVYPKNLEETLTVLGEKGTVVIGGLALNKILVWDFKDQKDSLKEIQQNCNEEILNVYSKGHSPLYKDFIASVNNGTAPLVDGYEGKKSLEIILMAYQSQKENKPIIYHKDLKISTTDFTGMLESIS